MFGILTMHLVRLVNYGHSYQNAEDLFKLLKEFPLQRSSFHLFKPCRNLLTWPAVDKKTSKLKRLHLLKFDSEREKAFGFYHSNVSTPIEYLTHKKEGLRIKMTIQSRENGNCQKGVIDIENGEIFFCNLMTFKIFTMM